MKTLPVWSKLVAFTSTKVTKFSGVTSYGRFAALVSPGGRRIECRPVSAGGKTGHAGRINRSTNGTLRITGPVGSLSTPVREDDSAGRGGPVDIRNSSGNTCC